jgi:hypothetical protein
MPVVKTYIKKTTRGAVVKIVGTGTTTINLTTDLLATGTDQSVTGTPEVQISGLYLSADAGGAPVTITRNSVDALQLFGNLNWYDMQDLSFTENPTSNIVIDMGTTGGTLILILKKIGGYSATSTF